MDTNLLPHTKSGILFFVVKPPTSVVNFLADEHFIKPKDAVYPTVVDFSHQNFNLKSLDGLESVKFEAIKELNVTRNSLTELILNINSIVCIRASHNLISTVRLSCKRLMELNLAHNKLIDLPDLDLFPAIEILDLSFNMISGSLAGLAKGQKKLRILDLSNNRFSFDSKAAFRKEVLILTQHPKLSSLNLYERNVFAFSGKDFKTIVLANCTKLETLDSKPVSRDEVVVAVRDFSLDSRMNSKQNESDSDSLSSEEDDAIRKLFGLTLTAVSQAERTNFPGIIDEIVSVLEKHQSFDMFFSAPANSELVALKRAFERSAEEGGKMCSTMPANVCANLLVEFFKSLVEPPIPLWAHTRLSEACKHKHRFKKMRHVLGALAPPNEPSVRRVASFLHDYVALPQVERDRVKMVWAPCFLGRVCDLTPEDKMMVMEALFEYSIKTDSEISSIESSSTSSSSSSDDLKKPKKISTSSSSASRSKSSTSGTASTSKRGTSTTRSTRTKSSTTSRTKSSATARTDASSSDSKSGTSTSKSTSDSRSRSATDTSKSDSHSRSRSGSDSTSGSSSTSTSKSGSASASGSGSGSGSGSKSRSASASASRSGAASGSRSGSRSRSRSRSGSSRSRSRSGSGSRAKPASVDSGTTSTATREPSIPSTRPDSQDGRNLLGIVVADRKSGPGVKIVRIIGGSPAHKSDLEVHDHILQINSIDVSRMEANEVHELLGDFLDGQHVEFEVERVSKRGEDWKTEEVLVVAHEYTSNAKKSIDRTDVPDLSSGYESSDDDQQSSSHRGTEVADSRFDARSAGRRLSSAGSVGSIESHDKGAANQFTWDNAVSSATSSSGSDNSHQSLGAEEEPQGSQLPAEPNIRLVLALVVQGDFKLGWTVKNGNTILEALKSCCKHEISATIVGENAKSQTLEFHIFTPIESQSAALNELAHIINSGVLLQTLAEKLPVEDVTVMKIAFVDQEPTRFTFDLGEVASLAPDAAMFGKGLERWSETMAKTGAAARTKTVLFEKWREAVAALELRAKDLTNDVAPKLEPAIASAINVDDLAKEYDEHVKDLQFVKAQNLELKNKLGVSKATDGQKTSRVRLLETQVAEAERRVAKAEAALRKMTAEEQTWVLEQRKLQAILAKKHKELEAAVQELDIQSKLGRVKASDWGSSADGIPKRTEKLLRYKIALESSQQQLSRSQATTSDVQAAADMLAEEATNLEADNKILEAKIRSITEKLEALTKQANDTARSVHQMQDNLDNNTEEFSLSMRLGAEIKSKNDEIAKYKARIKALETAAAQFVD